MNGTNHTVLSRPRGVCLRGKGDEASLFLDRLSALGLVTEVLQHRDTAAGETTFRLSDAAALRLTPGGDTTGLAASLHLDLEGSSDDQEREILLAMLACPVRFEYASFAALASSVQVRRNIANAAARTELAFDTSEAAERPCSHWTYSEDHGFTIIPGKPLIDALRKATQPEVSGRCYEFSCYRATEYVILLGIAEELVTRNPTLLDRLQRQWETHAIKSCAFHDTFLIEYGSMEAPLPGKFYVPGDRLWFRNPDERSSDVEGYEGSWVIYLGGGLFSNFWKHHQPYTLDSKCLEIHHWRNGLYTDAAGEPRIDESVVDAHVRASLNRPDEARRIITQMMRLRDPRGVYAQGGCIDTSREYPKSICLLAEAFSLPHA